MFKFGFKIPKKKEHTKALKVRVVPEVAVEDLKGKFDLAVRETLVNNLVDDVSVELFKMVYGQEVYEQSKALSNDWEALRDGGDLLKEKYPKAVYTYCGARFVDYRVDMKDLLKYLANVVAEEIIKGESDE